MDSSDPKRSGQSAALSVLLSVVDPGDLQVHLYMHPGPLLYAGLAHHFSFRATSAVTVDVFMNPPSSPHESCSFRSIPAA